MSTIPLADIDPAKFDAVYYPGGHGVMWDLVEDSNSKRILEHFLNHGLPTGLVCHAPAALRNVLATDGSPFLRGREFSGTTNSEERSSGLQNAIPFLLSDEMTRLGGVHVKAEDGQPCVVTDGNLVTGQNPASSAGVASGVLSLLANPVA